MDKDEDDAGSGKGLDEGDWSDDSDVDSSDEQLEAAGPGKRAYEPSIEIDALRFQVCRPGPHAMAACSLHCRIIAWSLGCRPD